MASTHQEKEIRVTIRFVDDNLQFAYNLPTFKSALKGNILHEYAKKFCVLMWND